jgi:prepilin-type N-terminal cleavage/methylation domain-containing protein
LNRAPHHGGFTLLELLVALVLLVTAMTIAVGSFSTMLRAWEQGTQAIDELHHGDFVMEQLVSGLRSAAFFKSTPDKYGFWLEDRESGPYPNDVISWVASGTAFIPRDSYLTKGMHRLEVTIEDNEDGDPAFAARAFPHLLDHDEMDDVEPWYISSVVKGIDCKTYNIEDEDWEDEWEDTNAIPSIIQVTLYMDPLEEYGDPVEITRMIRIPVAPAVTGAVNQIAGRGDDGGNGSPANGDDTQQQDNGNNDGGVDIQKN